MDSVTLSNANLFAALFGLIFLVVVPIVAIIVLLVKKKLAVKPLVFGFLSFIISQMVLRIPLMQVLNNVGWYQAFAAATPLLFLLVVGGFTAGLFEETARLVGAKALKNQRSYRDMLSFGFGHGICEVIVLVGLAYINNVLYVIAFMQPDSALFASLTSAMDATTIQTLQVALGTLTPFNVLMMVLERVGTVPFHMFNTCLVFRAVNEKKYGLYGLALLSHTLLNFLVVLVGQQSLLLAEIVMLAIGFGSVVYLRNAKKHFLPAVQTPVETVQSPE